MDTETDNKKPETPYKFCATTFLAAAGILLGATSALSAFLGNNLSKVIGVFSGDNLSMERNCFYLNSYSVLSYVCSWFCGFNYSVYSLHKTILE